MHSLPLTLINGKPRASLSVENRGLNYGDGLFETILVKDQEAKLEDYHIRRLLDGCRRLSISLDLSALLEEVSRLASSVSSAPAVLKIIITRQAAARGYYGEPNAPSVRMLSLAALKDDAKHRAIAGVSVRICRTALSNNPVLAGIKHLNRLEQVMARSEWQDVNIAEGLVLDSQGNVVEATQSNVFLVVSGRLITPLIDRCGVAGVMRQYLMDSVDNMSLELVQRRVSVAMLMNADEVFLCNSVKGIWPVTKIGCYHLSIGPVTRKLQRYLEERSLV